MINPVCVVGYGMIDGLGNNPSDCFLRMLDNVDYSVDIPCMIEKNEKHHKGIRVDMETTQVSHVSSKILRSLTNSQILALHATEQALKMSNLPIINDVAVVFSSVSSAAETTEEFISSVKAGKRVNPRRAVNRITDMVPAMICNQYGFMGASLSLQAACSTGLYTIDYAQRLCDEYEYVVVGASDYNTYYEQVKFFSVLGALGNHNCPFDDNREGFMIGDGGGCLILQTEEKAKQYNSKVYAKLYPAGYASDAFDETAPAPDNRGARIAITKALNNANLSASDIDAVSTHGTSTPVGDPIEYKVIRDLLETAPIYAPKSKIGHTLGAAGILECIYAILSMNNKVIPHCQNLITCSFDDANLLVKTARELPLDKPLRTLNNSFAFGGKCISQIIEVS